MGALLSTAMTSASTSRATTSCGTFACRQPGNILMISANEIMGLSGTAVHRMRNSSSHLLQSCSLQAPAGRAYQWSGLKQAPVRQPLILSCEGITSWCLLHRGISGRGGSGPCAKRHRSRLRCTGSAAYSAHLLFQGNGSGRWGLQGHSNAISCTGCTPGGCRRYCCLSGCPSIAGLCKMEV